MGNLDAHDGVALEKCLARIGIEKIFRFGTEGEIRQVGKEQFHLKGTGTFVFEKKVELHFRRVVHPDR